MVAPNQPTGGNQGPTEYASSTTETPYIITVSGHFSAGKDSFVTALMAQSSSRNLLVRKVVNYKSREPRGSEVAGADYIRIYNPQQYQKLIRDGKIVVPYLHDDKKYGLSSEFLEALKKGESPLMITDADGLTNLAQYLRTNTIPNGLLSFMLHTNRAEAERRMLQRSGEAMSRGDEVDIRSHQKMTAREFEIYRTHEELFRHIFRNDNVDTNNVPSRMQHLAGRAAQIIDLEGRLNSPTALDFREAYVDYAINKLFATPRSDLIGSINQGVVLEIPQDLLQAYAAERKLDPEIVRTETRKRVLHTTTHYGILTLYLEQTMDERQKRQLADLIGRAVGLNYQYLQPELNFGKNSKYTLTELKDGNGDLFDFIVSFSPYDPMVVPALDSRVHTIAFTSLTQPPHKDGIRRILDAVGSSKPLIPIEPVSMDDARKFIEGNGNS